MLLISCHKYVYHNIRCTLIGVVCLVGMEQLIRFAKTNLGRVYPFGLRFDSSNADPMAAWTHGIQVAAINIQGRDRAVWVAKAFFGLNGACGYVKKPDFLLPGSNMDVEKIRSQEPKLCLKVSLTQSSVCCTEELLLLLLLW